MRSKTARLLFPAVRWDEQHGFESSRADLEGALDLGVGGFIVFGGEAEAVRALTSDLQARSEHPLLIAADLERGAGQQFRGATALPPPAALGALDHTGVTRQAGELTAREARALGINWIYAPVADLGIEPLNPIVGTRAFGALGKQVASHVAAWVEGCHQGGALACAKHFPGHGRTTTDSHDALPLVEVDAESLEQDLEPFRAAIKARVPSIMTAHVRYPALDTDGTAATLSRRILTELLRERLGFEGLIATDAMNMKGVIDAGSSAAEAAVLAVAAGCDALVYPADAGAVVRALEQELGKRLPTERVHDAERRIDAAARAVTAVSNGVWGSTMDRTWAIEMGASTMQLVRGHPQVDPPLEIYTVDDDVGGPYPPPARTHFADALRRFEVEARDIDAPTHGCVAAVYCDIRAWKGRHGLSEASIARVNAAVEQGAGLIVLFANPRLAHQVTGRNVISAWGGEPIMQESAARWLVTNALA